VKLRIRTRRRKEVTVPEGEELTLGLTRIYLQRLWQKNSWLFAARGCIT